MSLSPDDRASAIFTTVASAVCCAPEPPHSAKFNSRRDTPARHPNFSPGSMSTTGRVYRRCRGPVHDGMAAPSICTASWYRL
jgi:hypothetical protein